MSDKPPKRMGRPPNDPSDGPGTYHLGLRFGPRREEQIKRLVEAANERARAAGLPQNVTASGLVTWWILERLDLETAKLTKGKR